MIRCIKYVFVALLVTLLCCNKNPTSPDHVNFTDSYFPLHLYDNWNYFVLEANPITKSVVSVNQIDKTNWYTLQTIQTDTVYQFFREEDNIVYVMHEGDEYLYLDFNKGTGETGESLRGTFTILSKNETIATSLATIKNCIKIVFKNSITQIVELYAPGIGLVSQQVTSENVIVIGGGYSLTKAVVDQVVITVP